MIRVYYYDNGDLQEILELARESVPSYGKIDTFGKVYCDTAHLEDHVQALCVNGRVVCVFEAYFSCGECVLRRYTTNFNHMTDSEFFDYQKFWHKAF